MSDDPIYILDANVFIEASKGYYAFDIAPRFWESLVENARQGSVKSIDRVKYEIDQQNDELKDWATREFHPWFESTDTADVLGAYATIMQWSSQQPQYTAGAKAEFARLNNADAWVIATALSQGVHVVTHELFNAGARSKIPIPNVCRDFNIEYMNTFELLRHLGVRLG